MKPLIMRVKYFMWGLFLYVLVSIWMYGLVWGPFAAICGIASHQACMVLSLSIWAVLTGGMITIGKNFFKMSKRAIMFTIGAATFMFVVVNNCSFLWVPIMFVAILDSWFCGYMVFLSIKERYLLS